MNAAPALTGMARTALVFGPKEAGVAVVSTVRARIRRSGEERITFAGPVQFDDRAVAHIRDTILPLVDRIEGAVRGERRSRRRIRPKRYELSVTNIGAASSQGVGLQVSGYSADLSVFVAMLSAALGIPIRQDILFTGHLASDDGSLRVVRSIPAKVAAAVENPSISQFVCPGWDADGSMDRMGLADRDRIQVALIEAKKTIRVLTPASVHDLLPRILLDEHVVLGSLKAGFFEVSCPVEPPSSHGQDLVRFLLTGNDRRLWTVIGERLLARQSEPVKGILVAVSGYFARRRRYPSGFGRRLGAILSSLPPATRRLKVSFPLLTRDRCLKLCQLASVDDYDDVRALMAAASGESQHLAAIKTTPPSRPNQADAEAAVQAVLDEINTEALARTIGVPIDQARGTYISEQVVLESKVEVLDAAAAFYLHLLGHTCELIDAPSRDQVAAEATALLERSFSDKGGLPTAYAEARTGIHGGLRFVIDAMTEQYKKEKSANHVFRVLEEAVVSLDLDERTEFMRAFLNRIGPELPADLRSLPPEACASRCQEIVRAYVNSMDRVRQTLRAI